MNILAALLRLSPAETYPEIEHEVLKEVYDIAASPLVSGAALDSVLAFFAALVEADGQIASHVVPDLVARVDKMPKAEVSASNAAKCVGQVVKSQQGVAAGVIAEYSRSIKVSQDDTGTAFFHRVSLSLERNKVKAVACRVKSSHPW